MSFVRVDIDPLALSCGLESVLCRKLLKLLLASY